MTEQIPPTNGTSPAAAPDSDPPVDLRRTAGAVRRSAGLVAAIVLVVTGVVLAVSLMSPERYKATARIGDDPAPGESVDIETADRQLATSAELVTSPAVLEEAARDLPGESVETLERDVSAAVDTNVSSILDVVVTGEDQFRVARVANTVSETFIAERAQAEQAVAARARERLARELERLREEGAPSATRQAVRDRLNELTISEVTVDPGLRLVQRAAVPSAPYAPRPVRSVVLAFFSALLLGLLIAILRDHVRPPVPDAATLGRIAGLPLLAALPAASGTGPRAFLGRVLGRSEASSAVDQTVIEEAALQGAVRGALPPRGQRVVLVHGIDQSDAGKQVAEALARSLAWGGHPTVLVRFERQGGGRPAPDVPVVHCTDILEQLDEIRSTEYRYVVVQSPRAARAPRLRPLAGSTTSVLLAARLGQASTVDAAAARRFVDALALRGLGLVLTCSPAEIPTIVRTSLAAPPRPPAPRSRSASHNGAHTAPTGQPALEPGSEQPQASSEQA
jgi:capsular polysaccharide biosynthesis protein